jgi:hypothetical protein
VKAPSFNDNNSGDFAPCPPGVYAACLVRLIDKGSRQESYQGGPLTWKRKLLLGFEICDDETRMENKKPFMAYREFTFSMHEKSALRSFIAGWRGQAFTDAEARDFDFSKLAGAFAMANIINKQRQDGTMRAELQSISKLPKGMTPAALVNEPITFDCDNPDLVCLAALGKRTQEAIEASPEYRAAMGEAPPAPAQQPAPVARAAAANPAQALYGQRQQTPTPAPAAATPEPAGAGVDYDDDILF